MLSFFTLVAFMSTCSATQSAPMLHHMWHQFFVSNCSVNALQPLLSNESRVALQSVPPSLAGRRMKLLFWNEQKWAFFVVAQAVGRWLERTGYHVDHIDWAVARPDLTRIFAQYDLVVIPLCGLANFRLHVKTMPRLRILAVAHSVGEARGFPIDSRVTYAAVSSQIAKLMQPSVNHSPVFTTLTGVELGLQGAECVPRTGIQKIGFIGSGNHRYYPNEAGDVKRVQMAKDIAAALRLPLVFASGYDPRTMLDFYAQIDMLLVTSREEAGPLGAFEAASNGVAVLSAPIVNSNWARVQGAAFFNTTAEAVNVLRSLQQNAQQLRIYSATLCEEVRRSWSYETLIESWHSAVNYAVRVQQ